MDTILISSIIKIFSIVVLSFFSFMLIRLQLKEQPTSTRQRMINFLVSAVFVIILEFIRTYFNTDNHMIWVSFQHVTLFSASLLHLFLLDWSISLRSASISNIALNLIDKLSGKFLIIPFTVNTIFMFMSFTLLNRLTSDCEISKLGYLIIIFFFKVNYLFITLLAFLFFPDIKNLKFLKRGLFFLFLSRISNLIFFVISKGGIDDFTKYIFILPAVMCGSIGLIKILQDKKKSCEETQPFDPECVDY